MGIIRLSPVADLDSMFGRSIAQYLVSPNRRRRGGLREGALAAIIIAGVGVCIIGTLVSILGVMWRRQMQQSEREAGEEGAPESSRRPEPAEEGEEAGGTCHPHNGSWLMAVVIIAMSEADRRGGLGVSFLSPHALWERGALRWREAHKGRSGREW